MAICDMVFMLSSCGLVNTVGKCVSYKFELS